MLTQDIYLRSDNKGITPVIHAVEGDTGRVLNAYTDDMPVTSSLSAELAIHRPDDSYYSISATTVSESGYYSVDLTQALTRPGKVECQLKVSLSGDVVSTYTFYVLVQKSTDGIPVEELGYDIYDLIDAAGQLQPTGGQPTPITTASQMTSHETIYLYMGTETGYSHGHIYYWDGVAFADGGAYGGEGGGGGGSVTVDSAMSSTSENPVQNKAIYTALQSKANSSSLAAVATSGSYNDLSNKPTIPTVPTTDSTVTAGGTNPVNSVAVIAYINSLDATNTAY